MFGRRRQEPGPAIVRATCRGCGDVVLGPEEVVVRICAEDQQGSFHFRCPLCRMVTVTQVGASAVDQLVVIGARVEVWHLPLELLERPVSGDPFGPDDADRFAELLEDDDFLGQLLSRGD